MIHRSVIAFLMLAALASAQEKDSPRKKVPAAKGSSTQQLSASGFRPMEIELPAGYVAEIVAAHPWLNIP